MCRAFHGSGCRSVRTDARNSGTRARCDAVIIGGAPVSIHLLANQGTKISMGLLESPLYRKQLRPMGAELFVPLNLWRSAAPAWCIKDGLNSMPHASIHPAPGLIPVSGRRRHCAKSKRRNPNSRCSSRHHQCTGGRKGNASTFPMRRTGAERRGIQGRQQQPLSARLTS